LNPDNKISVICFGGEDWWYHNRAHIDMQLMRRFARLGTTVYVNSIVMQKPNLRQGRRFFTKLRRKARSIFRGLQATDAGFWVYSPFTMPVHHIPWAKRLNDLLLAWQIKMIQLRLKVRSPIVWVACPAACDVALKMKKSRLVYQRTDRYEESEGIDVAVITNYDKKLKAQADLTIFVSKLVYDEERNQCKNPLYLDHGVDYDLFAGDGRSTAPPADIADLPRPIIGYFGEVNGHSVDIALAQQLADLLPEMSFVYIGNVSSDVSALEARKNVRLLPRKPYEEIPVYGRCFDVSIIPWVCNRWTQAANPIKLKEYLALGKPIVSTPVIAELESCRDVVYQGSSPREFADCVKQALAEDSPVRVAARRQRIQQDTWDAKAQFLLKHLYP